MMNIISKAAEFAKAAHASIDQRRKYTNAPYIAHPEAVARIVAGVTDDPAAIAAAWLHDVVEDTPVTIEQIEAEFGADIAGLVRDLTKVSKKTDGSRKQRKAIDRLHTAKADPRAKTVKLADLVDNLTDIVSQDAAFAVTYLQEKELLLEVLTEGNAVLYQYVKDIIDRSRAQLSK